MSRYNDDGTCSNCFEKICLGCQFKKCVVCHELFGESDLYEHRGLYACEAHMAEMQAKSERQKEQRDYLERSATDKYRGLEFGDGPIGKANREIFGRTKS